MPLSPALSAVLVAIVAVMAALFVAGARGRGTAPDVARRGWTLGLAVAAGYLGLSGALAVSGALADLDALPPPAGLLVFGLTGVTVALAFSRLGDRLLTWPLAVLVGAQAFRFPLELWLAATAEAGVVPVEMTYAGINFDIVTGVTAAALGLWLWRGRPPRWVVGAWNALGFALLLVVMATAVLSAFGVLPTDPRLTLPAMWPGVWLPAWLVQVALLGHLLVFRALRRERTPYGFAAASADPAA